VILASFLFTDERIFTLTTPKWPTVCTQCC